MGHLTALDVIDAVEVEPGRFVCTPHPVLLEGQTNVACDLVPGETLYSFLARHVDLTAQWEVSIGGVVVPVELWIHVRPKDGQIIECRGAVNKQALALVAMVALTYFTMGAGATWAAGWGMSAMATSAVYAGTFVAGSMLINKALAPKPPRQRNDSQDSVFSIQGQRNGPRPYEPVPLLFGTVQVTPDLASLPYTWYEGDDQYLGMALNFGIGVHRIDALQNGDTPLSSFEGATVYHNGFTGMPQQAIPVYSNADTIDGGTLEKNGAWIQRTTPADTIRVQINLEYILGGQGTSGKNYPVSETIIIEHRLVGSTTWQPTITRVFRSSELKLARETLSSDLPRGQYDIRVRMTGQGNYSGKNTQKNDFDWTTMTAVQADDASYAGLARAGIRVKATGQLRALDQLKAIAYSHPIPVWTGTAWVTETTSNPGAQILAYARGINDENGRRVAGIGMLDEQIDIASLQAFMVHCAANGYTYDFYLKGARSHQEVVDSIALAGFGQVSWETGKLGVVWSAAGQPLSGVVNMATIKKGQFQVDYNLSNAADGVEFTYLDRSDWQTKTIRVPAPGIVTMLNPAQIQGEGVTSEAHAAQLARYHLAQSLYQYKDISFSTDLEHLSYKRLDVLTLQHDLTQWGYGGRIMAISRAGAVVTVELDEPVPAPASGPAYIGLRVPGERVYRVFPVAAFTGESDTLQLAAPWPVDAPFPGEHPDNPAHDTIWIYDFKATPGYRVRVVSKELESDTKGASVSVVPESPEFWTYVKTGEYQPPAGGSLLDTRPKASNARVTELQVVTGDVIHTELSVTFDLKGEVSRTVIFAGLQGEELRPVDETITQAGRFRIGQAGTYTIVVRPYSLDGIAGDVATVTYSTIATDIPPPAFDWFTVTDEPGGLRRYAWGYTDDLGPPNLAGAEIRFIAGSVASPGWASMTPIGADGFHTAAFEAAIPASGEWTFAARARNTAGDLSPAFVLTKTLTGNLGEVIGGLEGDIAQSDQAAADALAAALAADAKAAQEIIDRQAADAQVKIDAALDATNKVQAEAQARADALLNERLAWEAAVSTETTQRQSADASLAQSISMVSAGSGEQFDSAKIWRFDTTPDGWSGNGTPTVVDGWLRPANHATSPYVQSPDNLDVDGSAFRYLKLRIQKVGNPVWRGYAQWTTTTDNTFNTAKRAQIAEPGFDANGRATIDFDDLPWWPATIRRLRITLSAAQTATDYYLLDWVAIGRPTPGASVALVQGVEQASIDRDGANALARETLAAQMRGTYTGTDVANVTQGLVWSERQARVAAISAEASRTDGIAAQINDPNTGLSKAHSRITDVDATAAAANSATAGRVSVAEARIGQSADNLVKKGRFDDGTIGTWTGGTYHPTGTQHPGYNGFLRVTSGAYENASPWAAKAGEVYDVSAFVYPGSPAVGESTSLGIAFMDTTGAVIVQPVAFTLGNGAAPAGYALRSGTVTTPANANIATAKPVIFSNVAGGAYYSDIRIVRRTAAEVANAQQIASVSLAVEQQDDFIQATADDVAALETEVHSPTTGLSTRASQTDFSALKSRADTVGGGIESMAGRLSGVEAEVEGKADASAYNALEAEVHNASTGLATKASSTAVTQVSAQLNQVGENAIRKGVFSADGSKGEWPSGWAVQGTSGHPSGRYLYVTSAGYEGTAANGFAAASGDVFDLSADSYGGAMTSGNSSFGLQFLDSAGASISQPVAVVTAAGQGWQLNKQGSVTAPAGTARARGVIFYSGQVGGYAAWQNLRAIRRTAQVASLSTASQTMRADVDSVTGKVNTSYTLAMNAGGKFSGVKYGNDGSISNAEFLFDNFNFVTADGSFQITGGRTITRSGGYMNVEGKPFGLGGDLVEWYGPQQSNLNNCTRSNAIFFKTNTGIFYAKGMIFAGIITAGGQTLALNATSYTTGTFGTNGGPIQINASFAHSKRQNAGQIGTTKNTIAKGAGTNGGSIELWRRIGGGGWEFVSGTTFGGTLNVVNYPDPEIAGYAQWSLGGSITYTDNVGGTAAREYEVRLTSLTMQDVTITGTAPIPAATEGRNIGVLTAEG